MQIPKLKECYLHSLGKFQNKKNNACIAYANAKTKKNNACRRTASVRKKLR